MGLTNTWRDILQLPEMLRVPLVELCLQIKILRLGSVVTFLERALEPPKVEAVKNAMATLHEVGAVDEEEEITPLGYHLAALPVDVHIAKVDIVHCKQPNACRPLYLNCITLWVFSN
jgi:HrpA-like RNA helicase